MTEVASVGDRTFEDAEALARNTAEWLCARARERRQVRRLLLGWLHPQAAVCDSGGARVGGAFSLGAGALVLGR